jgi:hypothetical protein
MHLRGFADSLGQAALAWRDHATDHAWIAGPHGTYDLGRVQGNFPLAWTPNVELAVQHDDRGLLAIYDLFGAWLRWVPAPYAAEGIASIDAHDAVVMMNDPSRFRTLPNGEFGHNIEETANFFVYQFGRDPDYGGSISRYDNRTGKTQRWLGYTGLPFTCVEDDAGELRVALCGDTPDPYAIQWADEFPPVVVPPPQPILIDLGPAPSWTGWVGCTSSVGNEPGNCTWGGNRTDPNGDPRPATEMAQFAEEYIGQRKLLHGLWLSDNGRDPVTVDAEIQFTKARGAKALAIHCDDFNQQRDNALEAADRVMTAGLKAIRLAHAVEYLGDFLLARGLFQAGDYWGITLNARTVNKDPALMAETIREVGRSLSLPGCTVLYVFGNFADIAREWPDLARWLTDLAAHTTTPIRFPGVPEPAPPVIVPPPVVEPPVVTRPNRGRGGKQEEKGNYFGAWKKG